MAEVGLPLVDTDVSSVLEAEKEQNIDKQDAVVFPPPITWANANGASGRSDMFAYVASNSIVIAELHNKGENTEEETWPSFTLMTQQASFACVNLCQQDYDDLPIKDSPVVTGDSAGLVRIWNLKTKACAIYHNSHANSNVTTSVTCVQWSPRDPYRIFSTDSQGGITVWNVKEKSLKKMKLESPSHLSCLAVSPFEDCIIAVGSLPGNILILDTSGGEMVTLHKMHHDEDLVNLSWVPSDSFSVELETHHETPLLISSVYTIKDPNIRVWDRNGQDVCVLNLVESKEETQVPVPPTKYRRVHKNFVPITWAKNPLNGEWNLFTSLKNNIIHWVDGSFELVHSIHSLGVIYCLIQTGDFLWSFGLESVIVGWNLKLEQPLVVVPTLKGICCADASPVDGTQVTLGGADGVLRVLSMREGYPLKGAHQLPMLASRIDARITAVAWHPKRDNLIGIGTHDGILGIYEYRDQNRFVRLFDRRAPGTVYSLDWGPRTYTKDFESKSLEEGNTVQNQNLQLYICAGDKIFSINPNPKNSNAALININSIIRKSNPVEEGRSSFKATDLRWSPDQTFLCVGYHDGRIDVHTVPYLNLRVRIRCHNRAIQHLLWRPYDFGPDSLSKWLASASNDGTIRLYNLAPLFVNPTGDRENISSSAVTLNGHGNIRVISLAWSPHDPKLLLSVSYDQSAVVWDILQPENPVARYYGHTQRLVACLFHPSHPFLVLTFSDELISDFPMHVWDFRNHPYRELSKCIITKVKNRVQAIKVQREEKEQEPMRLDKFVEVDPGKVLTGIEIVKPIHQDAEIDKKTVRQEVVPHAKAFVENFLEFDFDSLNKFGEVLGGLEDINSSYDVLKPEIVAHVDANCWKHAVELSLWTSTHTELIQRALKNDEIGKELVLIVLTQSYDPSFRTQVVASYAKKLIEHGDISAAVTYMLLIGRDTEAIDTYLDRKLFQEAHLLAKARLSGSIQKAKSKEIIKKWTCHLMDHQNYSQAYRLLCAANDYTSALEVLEEWNDPQAFLLALVLAKRIDNLGKAQLYGAKTLKHFVLNEHYSKCFEIVGEFPFLNWGLTFVLTHQLLKEDMRIDSHSILCAWKNEGIDFPSFPEILAKLTEFLQLDIPQTREEALLDISKRYACVLMGSPGNIENMNFYRQWFEETDVAAFCSVLSSDCHRPDVELEPSSVILTV